MAIRPCKFPQKLSAVANSLDFNLSPTMDGRYRVMQKGTRAYAMTGTEAEIRNSLAQWGRGEKPDLLGHLPVPLTTTPLTFGSLRPQDQVAIFPTNGNIERLSQWGRGQADPGSTGFRKFITPMKGAMQSIEKAGNGKAFSAVWVPTQAAKDLVGRELATELRPGLGGMTKGKIGRTYEDVVHALNKKYVALDPEQRLLATLRKEAFTKDELEAPGVFSARGMSQAEIGHANEFARLGVAEDIPVLMRYAATVEDFVKNRETTISKLIPRMTTEIQEGKLPQEMIPVLKSIMDATGNPNVAMTVDDVLRQMDLPANEIEGIKRLRLIVNASTDELNIPAIYRHATAPVREARFKTGREQFESLRGMSPQAKSLADEYDALFTEAFANHAPGVSSSQVLGAQLPVIRQFIDAGFYPGEFVGGAYSATKGTSAVNKYTKVLAQMPEGSEIFTGRVLSGHINPYEQNLSVQASKHVRNLVMRQHFDPVMNSPEVKGAVQSIIDRVPHLAPLLKNYMNEMEGIPNDAYKWLNDSMRNVARMFGKTIDDQFAERMLNQLNFLSSGATLPFRPGAILRQFYQTTLVPAVIGPEAWMHGLKVASGLGEGGFSLENARAAMLQATKAGALKADVIPIHAGSEAIEQAGQFLGSFGPALAKAGLNTKELFDMGFTAYRSPDDWGRTGAFFAGRHRVAKYLEAFESGKITLEQFKRSAKVKMFDETIEAQFEALATAKVGNWGNDLQDLIGKTLADDAYFLYGNASHPAGWNSVAGKLFGQFGTFPVQYLSYVSRGLTRGTLKDKAEFAFIHGAANLGIIYAGTEIADVDLKSWAFLPSLTYTGGPYADVALNLFQLYGGSDIEKNIARSNLTMMFPTWDHPNSIFVPGSFAVNDVTEAFRQGSYARALGFRQEGER